MSTKGNQMLNKDFVYLDTSGLLGSNYYWRKGPDLGISRERLIQAGVVDERVIVHQDIIQPLRAADHCFQMMGLRLYIIDGYRPQALYHLIQPAMDREFGQKDRERILNMDVMPHTTGKVVDVAIWNPAAGEFVKTRDAADKRDAYFVDFYKESADPQKQSYHQIQCLIARVMQANGFRLGKVRKAEYFHFTYDPTSTPRD